MVAKSLPLMFLESFTEAMNELVQFLDRTAQELHHIIQTPQTVKRKWADLGRSGFKLHRSGDAKNTVPLFLVIVERFLKQDGDH